MGEMARKFRNHHRYVIDMRVDELTYDIAVSDVMDWATAGDSRYVCAANVHMVMEGYDADEFRQIVNGADLVTPDGMPLVWALRMLGATGHERVCGPELMLRICHETARAGIPVGFYGGSPSTLDLLMQKLKNRFAGLNVVYSYSPPYRFLAPEEKFAVIKDIGVSGAKILFVGLGCPKQEKWMAEHRGKISAVMLGVGAAFDFHAGCLQQAPPWMQQIGMEWLFRLVMEPRRLWRRYAKHNPRFVILFLMQLLRLLKGQHNS